MLFLLVRASISSIYTPHPPPRYDHKSKSCFYAVIASDLSERSNLTQGGITRLKKKAEVDEYAASH
jgi:hypothetical protein